MSQNLKKITIRGIDINRYSKVMAYCKIHDLNIGEAFNLLMDEFLKESSFDNVDGDVFKSKKELRITKYDELTISKKDLIEADAKISFLLIDNLTFQDDVDQETFETYVKEISQCKSVTLPDIMPRLHLLSKVSGSQNINIRE